MLGHRGCRLAITYPEILEMQVQAILEAACEIYKKKIKVNFYDGDNFVCTINFKVAGWTGHDE